MATTPLPQTLIQTRPARTRRPAPSAEASLGAAEPTREQRARLPRRGGRGCGPAGGGGALGLSVGCLRGAGPSWQREVPGSWPQSAREPQEPNFWTEVVLPAKGRVPALRTGAWARGFHASGPGMALPLPRPGFVLEPHVGKAGPLARPVELGERTTNVETGGGLWVGLQHPPLTRNGFPLERDLADKEYPEGPQKVISRPGCRPLARLPQWGRFVLGPCNPFLGTAPQRQP